MTFTVTFTLCIGNKADVYFIKIITLFSGFPFSLMSDDSIHVYVSGLNKKPIEENFG